jgi:hypothetical protein
MISFYILKSDEAYLPVATVEKPKAQQHARTIPNTPYRYPQGESVSDK